MLVHRTTHTTPTHIPTSPSIVLVYQKQTNTSMQNICLSQFCTLAARLRRAKAFHAGNFTNINNTVLVQQKPNSCRTLNQRRKAFHAGSFNTDRAESTTYRQIQTKQNNVTLVTENKCRQKGIFHSHNHNLQKNTILVQQEQKQTNTSSAHSQ